MCRTRLLVGSLVVIVVWGLMPRESLGQRRGEVVEGLLRAFLESQMKSDRDKATQRQETSERHQPPHSTSPPRSTRPPHGVRRPTTVPEARVVSPQARAYRDRLNSFASASASLEQRLGQSMGKVPGVRPLMADALKLRTTAAIMYEQSEQSHDLALLRDEYCNLDCQWRELSFRLQQLRGLDSPTLQYIRQLDSYCDGTCELFGLQPQFDREEVFRIAVETTAYLSILLEDIQYELHGLEETDSLVGECRGLAEQARRLSGIAATASYDELTTKYSSFVSSWRALAAKLYALDNAYCDRGIRRIRSCNQRGFEHLWTPLSLDRAYLAYVSDQLAGEVNSLLGNMPVKALVEMPLAGQEAVLATARELLGHCRHYCECVQKNPSLNDLMSDYAEINRLLPKLDGYLASVTSHPVVASRHLIRAYDAELCGILRIPLRMDHSRAIQLAASLEDLAEHLRYDIHRYGRYYASSSFRSQAYGKSEAFHAQAKNLHTQLRNSATLGELQKTCNGLVTTWEAVSEIITVMPKHGLSGSRQQIMDESRQEVLPAIAELATMLGA